MAVFRKILVDIDAGAPVHPALERARRIARTSGATVTVADVLTLSPQARRALPPGVEEDLLARRRQQLERAARSLAGVDAEPRLLTGRPATALVQEILRSGHDLLVRSHARDLAARRPFGAVDMELLRKCPCPLLLAFPAAATGPPRIAGAVDASADDPVGHALNAAVVDHVLTMAEVEGGLPMLLTAWTPFGERLIRAHTTADVFLAYEEEMRQRVQQELARLTREVEGRRPGLPAMLRRGEPDGVIPEFAVAEGIDLIVMGTVARGGIAGLLIGNTAERILRSLPCSVLAVKPEGFVTPVTLDVTA
jgi:nucleotide-binding universal stress UspA family protein